MSTPVLVALNVLNVLTGGEPIVAKHRAEKATAKATVNYTSVNAVKCPHGHYVRWAAKNCKGCQ